MPDLGLVLLLVSHAVRATSEALVEASRVHDAELADDAAPGEARDGVATELVSLTVGIRSTPGRRRRSRRQAGAWPTAPRSRSKPELPLRKGRSDHPAAFGGVQKGGRAGATTNRTVQEGGPAPAGAPAASGAGTRLGADPSAASRRKDSAEKSRPAPRDEAGAPRSMRKYASERRDRRSLRPRPQPLRQSTRSQSAKLESYAPSHRCCRRRSAA